MSEKSFVDSFLNPPRVYARNCSLTRGGGRLRSKNSRIARKKRCAAVHARRAAIKRWHENCTRFIDNTLKQRSFASLILGPRQVGIDTQEYVCDKNGVCGKRNSQLIVDEMRFPTELLNE